MKQLAISLVICGSLALMLVFVSANLQGRFQNRERAIGEQLAYLRGDRAWFTATQTRYVPEFQNRILFPLLLQAVSRIPVLKLSDWYLLVRLATAMLAMLVFWHVLAQAAEASAKLASLGSGALAYAVVYTFNFATELPSDFFDILFVALFVWATHAHNKLGLAGSAMLACTNRESAAFAGLIWAMVWGLDRRLRPRWRDLLFGAAVALGAYGLILLLRFNLGGTAGWQRQMLGGALLWQRLGKVLADPNPFAWPLLLTAMLLPLGMWLASTWHTTDWQARRFLLAAGIIGAISLVFGIAEELRVFLPALVLLVFVIVRGEATAQGNLTRP